MNENKYALAGWLAITQAVVFPVAFIIGIVQAVIAAQKFGYSGPVFGLADLIFTGLTVVQVYLLIMFRRLLNERYDFHEIDILIMVAVWWNIVFQLAGLGLKFALIMVWPVPKVALLIVYVSFMTAAMISAGIVNIMIGVRLLKIKELVTDMVRILSYVILASGISQATILLSFVSLLLLPVHAIVMGIMFLKEKEQVEFV